MSNDKRGKFPAMDNGAEKYDRFLNGDSDALGELVQDYFDSLVLFVNKYINDYQAAEDVVEDVFAKLLLKKYRFNQKAAFKTYLYKAGRNEALNYIRKNKRIEVNFDKVNVSPGTDSSPEEQIITKEDKLRLYRCIEKLPSQYGEILHLIYFDGLDYDQISVVLHKNKEQLKNLTYRAKTSLKEILKKEGDGNEIN